MENADLPPEPTRSSVDAGCLAALAHALRAPNGADGAERLLRGLQEPLGLMGGLVLVRPVPGDPEIVALDLPDELVREWRAAPDDDLEMKATPGLVSEPLGESGRIHPDLKLSGVRTVWTVPLHVD
ncbi:MAG TPA: hypothetical protein VKU85_00475, partial [bacterium]|nr:hypothetical protein [bacterium]